MFNSLISPAITISSFIACMATAIVLGVLTSLVFSFRSRHSSSFTLALALLPAAVTMVIMMVNGNVGAGLAVAGTFALVRFRSAQGTAREIVGLFLSMSIGLVCGMGYIYVAMLYFAIMAAFVLLLTLAVFVLAVLGCVIVVALLVMVISGYVRLYELTSTHAELTEELNALTSEQTRLEGSYESKLDMEQIEKVAAGELGMHLPTDKQIVYLNMAGEDSAVVYDSDTMDVGSVFHALQNGFRYLVDYIRAYFS